MSFRATPKIAVLIVCLVSCYFCMVNVNISRRARAIAIEKERRLSVDQPGSEGQCVLTAPTKVVPSPESTTTLLASYPGSGKRFVYEIIEGLTDHAPGDDHDFSGNNHTTLHVKTSYPNREGTWTWGDKMDQMILLLRNPRWAIPSYHTMRFELDFSTNWADSYSRIPYVYTIRPAVADWEKWRDDNFDEEIQNWVDFIDFWMGGGLRPDDTIDPHCTSDLDCHPKLVLDFDTFYSPTYVVYPNPELLKLGHFLDASANVEIIDGLAKECIFNSIVGSNNDDDNEAGATASNYKVTHNSNRNGFANSKRFTSAQLQTMLNTINGLISKYSGPEWNEDSSAEELVDILTRGAAVQIQAEYFFELDLEQE